MIMMGMFTGVSAGPRSFHQEAMKLLFVLVLRVKTSSEDSELLNDWNLHTLTSSRLVGWIEFLCTHRSAFVFNESSIYRLILMQNKITNGLNEPSSLRMDSY